MICRLHNQDGYLLSNIYWNGWHHVTKSEGIKLGIPNLFLHFLIQFLLPLMNESHF